MPYNSETSAYERRAATVIDATPDGDTVAVAIDVKLDQGIDDYVADLNHHAVNGNHYPATSVGSDSRYLKQSPAGAISWERGAPIDNAITYSNILGTVSQSSGVPTGAIIERGSNANGEYVRFADGTQICNSFKENISLGTVTTRGSLYSYQLPAFTFPAAFSETPTSLIGAIKQTGVGFLWIANGNETTTALSSGSAQIMNYTNDAIEGSIKILAIGRWF